MIRRRVLSLAAGAALAAAAPARAQLPVNPIHPTFQPLDADGKPVRSAAALSVEKTCGQCHDAPYIAAHTGHAAPKVVATCVECHGESARLAWKALGYAGDPMKTGGRR